MKTKVVNFKNSIMEMVEEGLIPGASWAYVRVDQSDDFYTGKLGETAEFKNQNVVPELLYDLASLTKVIGTTTRIIQLIDQGRLEWESPISEILLNYPNLKCTIMQLLQHSSGLAADFQDKSQLTWSKVDDYLKQIKVTSAYNDVIYSDIGYLVLGLVIEKMDEMDLERSFKTYIFGPMEMTQTSYHPNTEGILVPTEVQKDGKPLVGVVHDSKARLLNRPIGSAGLFSTLSNLVNFSQRIMTNSMYNGCNVFSQKSYEKLSQINSDGRSLGWEWLDKNASVLFHTGFTGTSIGIDLEKKEALVLLTNRVHPNRHRLEFLPKRKQAYLDFFKERNK